MKKLLFLVILQFAFPRLSPGEFKHFKFSSLRFEIISNYDDNILRYSDRDIDRFVDQTEYSLSKISSTDDWKNDFRLKFYFDGPRIFKKPLKIRYFVKTSSYFKNSFKNYLNHAVYIRQEVRKIVEFDFKYFFMPEYYLREYNDRDLDEYHSCYFADEQIRFGISVKPMKSIEIGLQVEDETLYYNKNFTEYDSESRFSNVYYIQKIGKDISIAFNYGFKESDNIGYIPVVTSLIYPEVVEDSEYGDSSYESDIYEVSLGYRLRSKSGKDTNFALGYKLRNRFYTTDNLLNDDPFHAGREDKRSNLSFDITQELSDRVDFGISYLRDWRKVDSLSETVSDIKDFKQNIYSLTLSFKLF